MIAEGNASSGRGRALEVELGRTQIAEFLTSLRRSAASQRPQVMRASQRSAAAAAHDGCAAGCRIHGLERAP